MSDDRSRAGLFIAQELGVRDLVAAQGQLAHATVALAVAPGLADDRLPQLAMLVAANILWRLGPYCPAAVEVLVPDDARVAPGVPLLRRGNPLAAELRRLRAAVRGDASASPNSGARCARRPFDLALVLGDEPVDARQVVHGWYAGWTGGFSRETRGVGRDDDNPFGPLLAGALGATALSRLLLDQIAAPGAGPGSLPDHASLSAYTYDTTGNRDAEPEFPTCVEFRTLEPALIVGAGATAAGLTLGLAALRRARGAIDIVDDDVLDESNLERHLISTRADLGTRKAGRAAAIFANGRWNGLRLRPHDGRYEGLTQRRWRTVVAAVDSAVARRRLQFDLPRVLLNAGTIGSEFVLSRHDYGPGPCAECLYPEPLRPARIAEEVLAAQTGLSIEEVLELLRSGAPISLEQGRRVLQDGGLVFPLEAVERAMQEGIRSLTAAACTSATIRPDLPAATIGFVSALPGILLAAEMVKETAFRRDAVDVPPLLGNRNVFRMDTFGDFTDALDPSVPSRGCRCNSELMQQAYKRRW